MEILLQVIAFMTGFFCHFAYTKIKADDAKSQKNTEKMWEDCHERR